MRGRMALDLQTDGSAFLADFGEAVTYYPAAGGSRPIVADVERAGLQSTPGGGRSVTPATTVTVRNSSTAGISSSELKVRGDKIAVAERIGGTSVQRLITRVLSEDAGFMKLELA